MKRSIKFVIVLIIISFLLILTRSILGFNGYEISFYFFTDTSVGYLISIIFFGLLFLLFILLAVNYSKLRLFNIIFSIVVLGATFVFGLGLLFEISEYKPVYNEYVSYDHFLENFNEENGITGYFKFPNTYLLISYEDKNNDIIDILNSTTLEEYNTGVLKNTRFDGVVTINQEKYYIILDQSLTKLLIEYHVDSHLYYKIYTRYYNIDYNIGKDIYNKAIENKK